MTDVLRPATEDQFRRAVQDRIDMTLTDSAGGFPMSDELLGDYAVWHTAPKWAPSTEWKEIR